MAQRYLRNLNKRELWAMARDRGVVGYHFLSTTALIRHIQAFPNATDDLIQVALKPVGFLASLLALPFSLPFSLMRRLLRSQSASANDWKTGSIVKHVVRGTIAWVENVPVGQVDEVRVTKYIDGLTDEARTHIAEAVTEHGVDDMIRALAPKLQDYEIAIRVCRHAIARAGNIPVSEIDEKRVLEVVSTLDEETRSGFAAIAKECGEEQAISEFTQVIRGGLK